MKQQRQGTLRTAVTVLMDPNGVSLGWGGGLQLIEDQGDKWRGWFGPQQMRSIADLFRSFPVLTLRDIVCGHPLPPAAVPPPARGLAEELARVFPVVIVYLDKETSYDNYQVFSLDGIRGPHSAHFWDAMHVGVSGEVAALEAGSDLDGSGSDDSEVEDAVHIDNLGPGRPRLEDSRRFGWEVVAFVGGVPCSEACVAMVRLLSPP